MTRTCGTCAREVEPDGIRCPTCLSRFEDLTRERTKEYYSSIPITEPTDPNHVSFEEFYGRVTSLYDRCERAARSEETLSYREALENEPSTGGIYTLFAIGSIEYEDGRPLLTSVVAEGGDIPGPGYFQLAATLGAGPSQLPEWDEDSKRSWWGAELQRVYDVWSEERTSA